MPDLYSNSECPEGSVPYRIRAGDTLNRIAGLYNSDIQDIINANPGINPNFLWIGQPICVPLKIQRYPSCPTTNYYVVRAEDSLASIAEYFNITPQQLLYSNYGIDPNDLYVDQVLCIPVAPSPVTVTIYVKDRRLLVYRNEGVFKAYAIAAESPSNPVPKGTFTVLNKRVDPGEESGARWLGLSEAGFGIRGTNTLEFFDIASAGHDVILSNQDISELFNLIPVGTVMNII